MQGTMCEQPDCERTPPLIFAVDDDHLCPICALCALGSALRADESVTVTVAVGTVFEERVALSVGDLGETIAEGFVPPDITDREV